MDAHAVICERLVSERPGVDYSLLLSAQRRAMPGWPLSAGIRSGCVPRGLNNSSSVDHAPSLGVRPNVQTGFAPKVEETLGHCRKPHMGTGAFRARKAAHLRLTSVGPVPSVHSGMQTWYAGQAHFSSVRIAISSDTTRIVYDTLDVDTVTGGGRSATTRHVVGQVQRWADGSNQSFSSPGASTQSR